MADLEVPIVVGPDIVRRVRVSAETVAEMLDVLREVVEDGVANGASCDDPTLACTCWGCRAIRVLVEVEGPWRCVICGCDEDHACAPEGCGWADETKRICDRHPAEDITTARLVLAAEEGRR